MCVSGSKNVSFSESFTYVLKKLSLIGSNRGDFAFTKFGICKYFNKLPRFLCYSTSKHCRKLRIWSHLLEKSLMEKFVFCTVRKHYRILDDAHVILHQKLLCILYFLSPFFLLFSLIVHRPCYINFQLPSY